MNTTSIWKRYVADPPPEGSAVIVTSREGRPLCTTTSWRKDYCTEEAYWWCLWSPPKLVTPREEVLEKLQADPTLQQNGRQSLEVMSKGIWNAACQHIERKIRALYSASDADVLEELGAQQCANIAREAAE